MIQEHPFLFFFFCLLILPFSTYYPIICLFHCILSIQPGVELLHCMVILVWIFWWLTTLFSTRAVPFCITSSNAQKFRFSISISKLIFCPLAFFYSSHPNGCKWSLTVVQICISLTTSGIEHHAMCLLATYTSSPEKCLIKFVAYFYYLLQLSCKSSLSIMGTNPLSDI